MKDSEIYECVHKNKILRKINSDYTINVCDDCFDEFNNIKTRPLFLAKQILTLSNNMIEKMPEFINNSDKSMNLWHNCNKDVLEQLNKLNHQTNNDDQKKSVKDETEYNFDKILRETELNENKQSLDGKNLHDLYRHSTKLIK